jgi:hypothetical protein
MQKSFLHKLYEQQDTTHAVFIIFQSRAEQSRGRMSLNSRFEYISFLEGIQANRASFINKSEVPKRKRASCCQLNTHLRFCCRITLACSYLLYLLTSSVQGVQFQISVSNSHAAENIFLSSLQAILAVL